jgi:hypothetical protein
MDAFGAHMHNKLQHDAIAFAVLRGAPIPSLRSGTESLIGSQLRNVGAAIPVVNVRGAPIRRTDP